MKWTFALHGHRYVDERLVIVTSGDCGAFASECLRSLWDRGIGASILQYGRTRERKSTSLENIPHKSETIFLRKWNGNIEGESLHNAANIVCELTDPVLCIDDVI